MEKSLIKKYLIFLFLILILFFISFLFYKKIENFEDIKTSVFDELLALPILDFQARFHNLKNYLNNL